MEFNEDLYECPPMRLKKSSVDYDRVQLLHTMLGVIENPTVHPLETNEMELEEWQRQVAIEGIKEEIDGVTHVGGAFYDWITTHDEP